MIRKNRKLREANNLSFLLENFCCFVWYIGKLFLSLRFKLIIMNNEDIRKAFVNSPKPQTERKFKGVRGCINYGYKDINDFSHCGDKRCEICNITTKAIEDMLTQMTFKPYEK